MFSHKDDIKTKSKSGKRSRIGAVAVLALIIALVGAVLFQAYLTHVLSDMKASQYFDTVSQYEGERQAIGKLVKEAVLQYYECPRMDVSVTSVKTILDGYLAAMTINSTLTYTVSTVPTLPSNSDSTFWAKLTDSDSDGSVMNAGDTTAMDTGFMLVSEALPDFISKSHMAKFIPVTANALSIQTTAYSDLFTFVVTRTDTAANTASSVTFTYYVRMFQVPVTDYNLVAYAMADTTDDIVATPPTMTADTISKIKGGSINALCLSKMDLGNSIALVNTTSYDPLKSYPYMYRELFSAANGVWEWAFYKSDYMANYFPTATGNGVYLVNLSTTPSEETVTVDGVSYADEYGTTGFTPAYYNTSSPSGRVSCNGYPETISATTGYPTGFTNWAGTTNYATEALATAAGVTANSPTKVSWTFNLNTIALAGSATERRIYIKLPDTATPASTIRITDSSAGSGVTTPVVICIEGWARYNAIKNGTLTTVPANYSLYLGDEATTAIANLTDQQILIYAVGANIIPGPSGGAKMNGAILLDDRLAGLDSVYTLTLNGLFAWSGGDTTSATASPGNKVSLTNLSLSKLSNTATGGTASENSFRALAPRYLLVNVQGKTTIN